MSLIIITKFDFSVMKENALPIQKCVLDYAWEIKVLTICPPVNWKIQLTSFP